MFSLLYYQKLKVNYLSIKQICFSNRCLCYNSNLLSFQIDLFVEHLQASTVNDKIFPNIVSGFMDTNPVVRESTIKV